MRTEKQEKMFALVEQWQAGTMTQKQFCGDHKITLSTFVYWVGRYRREKNAPQESTGFVRIDPKAPFTAQGQPGIELTYPNGVRISITGADPSSIAQLIHLW